MKQDYLLTPEFQRNLWLQFSPFKIVAVPVFILLTLAACHSLLSFKADFIYTATSALVGLSAAAVMLIGNYEVARSFNDEKRQNSWDFQKMSSITPFELAIGKLFGAASYAWYFVLSSAAIIAVLSILPNPPPAMHSFIERMLFIIIGGVFGNAMTGIASIQFMESTGKKNTGGVIVPFIIGIFTSCTIASLDFSQLRAMFPNGVASWYGMHYDPVYFYICSVFFFGAWAVIGLIRAVKKELLYKMTPVVWVLFLACLVIYNTGLQTNMAGLLRNANILMLLAYAAGAGESADLARYKRFFGAYKSKNWNGFLENMPLWVATMIAWVPVFMAMAFIADGNIIISVLTMLFFGVRDLMIVHAIRLNRLKNEKFLIMFYYMLSYGLLPMILGGVFFFPHYWLFDRWEIHPTNVIVAAIEAGLAFAAFHAMTKRAKARPAE